MSDARSILDTEGARLDRAKAAREAGQLDEALGLVEPLLKTDPQHLRALAELARIRRAQGNREASLAAFEAILAIDPADPQALVNVATELRQLGRVAEAEARLADLLIRNPSHPTALAELARTRRAGGDQDGAMGEIERAIAADPTDVRLQLELVVLLREAGRLADAEARVRALLVAFPEHFGALQELGRIARRRSDHAAAAAAFAAAARAQPGSEAVRIDLAAALCECGRHDQADALLRTVLARSPNHFHALLWLGQVCLRRSDREGARAAFAAAAAASPETGAAVLDLAELMSDLGQIEEAERLLVRFVAADPQNAAALCGLAAVKFERFELDQAEELYRRAADVAPQNPAGPLGLGHIARRRGDRLAALDFFAQAVACDPTNQIAAQQRASELCELGRFAEAEQSLTPVGSDPQAVYHYQMQLGQLRRRQGLRQQALDAFAAAHAAVPGQVMPVIQMAVERRALGQPREAYGLLKEGEKIAPGSLTVLLYLSEHLMAAEDYATAAATAKRAIVLHARKYEPYVMASRALIELGAEDEAMALLDEASKQAGSHPEVVAAKAALLFRRRAWQEAARLLEECGHDLRQHECLWGPLIRIALVTGHYDKAEALLASLPRDRATNAARIALLQGQLAEARWQIESAIAHYREAIAASPQEIEPHSVLARAALKLLDLDTCREHLELELGKRRATALMRGRSANRSQTQIGQLIDEFSLDRPLLEQLQAVGRLPAEAQIASLKEIVRANPDHTGASITLLIAQRRLGDLRFVAPPFSAVPNAIPRRIVQYWDDQEAPKDIAQIMSSWPELHPSFEYIRFDDRSARKFLDEHSMQATLAAWRELRDPAQKADLICLAYLAVEGGYYTDADNRCLVPVTTLVPPQAAFVTYQEEHGALANNFIGAVPGHPVIRRALGLATEALNRGDRDFAWLSTGPGLLTRAFCQFAADDDPCVAAASTTIMDLGYLQRHVGLNLPDANKRSDRERRRSSFVRTVFAAAARIPDAPR